MTSVAEVLIPLANVDQDAIVDDEDEVLVAPYRWILHKRPGYVVATVPHPEGGYITRKRGGRERRNYTLALHRLLMGLEYGDPREVDHKNRNKLDNRRFNLEIVTGAENSQNWPVIEKSSRYRGVSWLANNGKWASSCAGRWQATARVGGKQHFLGYFDIEEEAGRVVAEWRAEHMPFSEEGRARRGGR